MANLGCIHTHFTFIIKHSFHNKIRMCLKYHYLTYTVRTEGLIFLKY
jgi:hypothetical protein